MNERMLDLADEAGFWVSWDNNVFGYKSGDPINDLLEKFAALVRDDALEEAAKVCDGWAHYEQPIAVACAGEIRKLKDKP